MLLVIKMKFLIQVSITHLPTWVLNVISSITNTSYNIHSNHILKYGLPAPRFEESVFSALIILASFVKD